VEFLAQAEPLSCVMALVWLFAAGMFPAGIMLGSDCSPCCGIAPCGDCTEGELPETLTVTLNGFPDLDPGDDLIALSLSACFGSGATARVTAPGGTAGPISAASVTNGGSGYARLGRVEPTLVATVTNNASGPTTGAGATFTPSLTKTEDDCGLHWWDVTSISCSGGAGYVTGDVLTLTNEATGQPAASATIEAGSRSEPTISASVAGGSGASFSVEVEPAETTAGSETWSVKSVTVVDGGSGYENGAAVQFSGADGVLTAAEAVIQTEEIPPVVDAAAGGSGSGAELSVALTKTGPTYWWPYEFWTIDAIDIVAGGSGYAVDDAITLSLSTGFSQENASAYVSSVSGTGAITGVTVVPVWSGDNGVYLPGYGDVIESVQVTSGGSYFSGGAALSATVYYYDQEALYEEDPTGPAYVADVSVSIDQTAPSNGTGANLSAVVDDEVGSATFGQINAITIDDGGSGYLAYELVNRKCCGQYYNGRAVVMRRSNYGSGDTCKYEHRFCGVGNTLMALGSVSLTYHSPSIPPTLTLLSEQIQSDPQSTLCNTDFTASSNVTDCGVWDSVSFTSAGGATATVSAGGAYDAAYRNPGSDGCFICCHGEGPMPSEVEFDVTGGALDGVYVGAAYTNDPGNSYGWSAPVSAGIFIYAILRTCATQWPYGWDEPEAEGPYTNSCEENNCHTTCQVRVTIEQAGASTIGSDWCNCEETPRCDPYGEYEVSSYTVTVSAPL
jgi:hypothetical protein